MGKETALPRAADRARTPAGPRGRALEPGAAAVLRLQAGAGNAAVGRLLERATVAPEARSEAFPGFSQGRFNTCGAASLLAQVLIWDAQSHVPGRPRKVLIDALDVMQEYYRKRGGTVKNPGSLRAKLGTEWDNGIAWMEAIRESAYRGEPLTQDEYVQLSVIFYNAVVSASSYRLGSGLASGETDDLRLALGLDAGKSETINSLRDVFASRTLRDLSCREAAQVLWVTGTGAPHVFTVGRFRNGNYYLYDSAPRTGHRAVELEASTPEELQAATVQAIIGKVSQLGFEKPTSDVPTAIAKLGGPGAIAEKSRPLEEGDVLAQVDAGFLTWGEEIVCGEFIGKYATVDAAEGVWKKIPDAMGGVIVEMPKGSFSLFGTSTVGDANLHVREIDGSTGVLGSDRPGENAWLMLCTPEGRYRSRFKVY